MMANCKAIGVAARGLAAAVVLAVAAPAAATALTTWQMAQAKTLAERMVEATQRANLTADDPITPRDETRLAIERAIQREIEIFDNGRSPPALVAEALFLAKARLVSSGDWCPFAPAAARPSTKSRAGPELSRSCAMGDAYAALDAIVRAASDVLPAASGVGRNALGPPPTGAAGGAGGGVIYAGVK